MSRQIRNVIVIGGGGNLGRYVVQELLHSGFRVSILSRLTSSSMFPSNVTVHKVNYDEASLLQAFQEQDAAISTIAMMNVPEQMKIIDAAARAGVKRFIPSEFEGDTTAPSVVEYFPTARRKPEVLAYLKKKEPEGMTWTAICCGVFFDLILGEMNGALGWNLKYQKAVIYDSGDQPYEASNVAQVGKAVASTLLHLSETENRHIYVNSFTLTQNLVLAALEKACGRKWDVTRSTTKELATSGYDKMQKGDVANGVLDLNTAAIYGPRGLVDFGNRAAKYNKILCLDEENLDETIRRLVYGSNV
ncbi:hypothetical protein MMC18_003219 [Xylographa bjoerkii]|nr:hypothetical protein [Xylographa bjoerkii]